MRAVETGAPAAALAELKAYLRIEDAREDALLAALLRAATETVEAMLGVLLFEREVVERGVVAAGAVALSAEPARSLVAAALVAADGGETALAGARFEVSRDGVGRLLVSGLDEGAQVSVRYRAGMGADWNWVPEVLRLAVLRAAAHFHAYRDAADDAGLPPAVRRMLAPWRVRRVR
jgi:uncharacterized phiE125 gp8 family phage protein